MNNTHLASKANKVKGKVKEEAGHLTGNASLEAEGVKDQVKSKFQKVVADTKDTVKKTVDKFLKDKDSSEARH